MSPAGFFAVVTMPIVGRTLGRGTDARWVIAAGLLIHGRRQFLDVADEPGHQSRRGRLAAGGADHRACAVLRPCKYGGLSLYAIALRGAAVGLLSLLRNEGGSVGTSMGQTIQERRDQFHSLRLGEWLDPFNAAARSFLMSPPARSCSRPAIWSPRGNWRCNT